MTTTHSARVYAHAKRKQRTLKLLDQLGLVLIGEPVAGKCMLHWRKYDYLPDEQIEFVACLAPDFKPHVYDKRRGSEWIDDYCYYHVYVDGVYKLFRTLDSVCKWAEQQAGMSRAA